MSSNFQMFERALIDGINRERRRIGKPVIPVSYNLQGIARMHAYDYCITKRMKGHLHSWSSWTYFDDHRNAHMMHNFPRLHSRYTGDGYEVAVTTSNSDASPEELLAMLLNSPGHRDVILSQGIWRNDNWGAMGVGYMRFEPGTFPPGEMHVYMCAWFGVERDTDVMT